MTTEDLISVGVDTSSGGALTFAVLDADLRPSAIAEGDLDALLALVLAHKSAFVAVNAPSHLSGGVVRKRMQGARPAARQLRGAEIRVAERELRDRGIGVSATPSNAALCPPWMQLGLSLFRELAGRGFKPFPTEDADFQYLETHPHGVFTSLLGCLPLPKPTLEGRLQRALVLFEQGVRIRDPMTFLEEITRHRLLHGVLPTDLLPSQQSLDALAAAYTAWAAAHKPAETISIGEAAEGMITLPVTELQAHY